MAVKFLSEVPLDSDDMRAEVAGVFATIHISSQTASARMAAELKRYKHHSNAVLGACEGLQIIAR